MKGSISFFEKKVMERNTDGEGMDAFEVFILACATLNVEALQFFPNWD